MNSIRELLGEPSERENRMNRYWGNMFTILISKLVEKKVMTSKEAVAVVQQAIDKTDKEIEKAK